MLVVGIGELWAPLSSLKTSIKTKSSLPGIFGLLILIWWMCFQAKGKERQWLKNQALGELDDTKIIDGLTGEKAIYKRRGELEPEVFVFSWNFLIFESATPPKTATLTPTVTHNFDLYLSGGTFQRCVCARLLLHPAVSAPAHSVSSYVLCCHLCAHAHSRKVVPTLIMPTHTSP